ncbi:hypothetical protein R1flu_017899 [Riccia fluitans]|uniref:Uncharacterized protein n=1 Tax=Riccia fluitans TaxID=41844 RepID=A0ABD1ZEA5_9MARC
MVFLLEPKRYHSLVARASLLLRTGDLQQLLLPGGGVRPTKSRIFPLLANSSSFFRMGRAKVLTKKLPIAVAKEVLESAVLNPVPVQRKRGRPRKVITKEELLPAEEKNKGAEEETVSQLTTESVDAGKKRKRPKKLGESTDSGAETNGGALKFSDEPAKPQIVRREGSRRKSEPRRAAGLLLQ